MHQHNSHNVARSISIIIMEHPRLSVEKPRSQMKEGRKLTLGHTGGGLGTSLFDQGGEGRRAGHIFPRSCTEPGSTRSWETSSVRLDPRRGRPAACQEPPPEQQGPCRQLSPPARSAPPAALIRRRRRRRRGFLAGRHTGNPTLQLFGPSLHHLMETAALLLQ